MIKLVYVVAVRHPLWLPPLNTGLPPTIDPGDWLLSSWSGRCSQYIVKLDLDRWYKERVTSIWNRQEYPPMGRLPGYALEVLLEGYYDDSLPEHKPWIEVIGNAEQTDAP